MPRRSLLRTWLSDAFLGEIQEAHGADEEETATIILLGCNRAVGELLVLGYGDRLLDSVASSYLQPELAALKTPIRSWLKSLKSWRYTNADSRDYRIKSVLRKGHLKHTQIL